MTTVLASFLRREAINLKKSSPIFKKLQPFPSWPSAVQDMDIFLLVCPHERFRDISEISE